ncbi:MAG: 30S ribosomal protein THX [Flavobacteriales bacterium]
MGKGDKKSKRGKITIGSYGVRRKRKTSKPRVRKVELVVAEVAEKPSAKKVSPKTKKSVKAEA